MKLLEADVENILRAMITVFALVLLVVSLAAYRRVRNHRILLTSAAFGLFLVKGILLSWELVDPTVGDWLGSGAGTVLDLLILLFLALTVLKA